MNFSKILKQERKKINLTQSELAEILNVSDKTISSWENGRSYPDIIMLKSLASALKVDVLVLLNADDFNIDVNDIGKVELKENHTKESKYIKNVIIAIFLNIPIAFNNFLSLMMSHIYETNYTLFPILIVFSFITRLISLVLFISSSIDFKRSFIDNDYNTRYKLIMYRYTNIYTGTLGLLLYFAILTYGSFNIYSLIVVFLILLIIYIIINTIIGKRFNLVQQFNTSVIIEIVLITILGIASIVMMFIKVNISIVLLLPPLFAIVIFLLHNKDEKNRA